MKRRASEQDEEVVVAVAGYVVMELKAELLVELMEMMPLEGNAD